MSEAQVPYIDRDMAIKTIRANLKARSSTPWSVKGDRGTAWGWITITAAPRINPDNWMSEEQIEELSALLGERVHQQGASIADRSDYRQEYIDRSAGKPPSVIGQPYWD